ncbi:beta-phosphoglucomutase [uncultured Sphaerochaeta sp.]|uniref:beta-phosphoglucomutase n=1 Tax=uncultured Sphaerochaeta sp. TaxID=886478 RepID=UPI002A0A88FF|nr:beta-phosphoglucomutase [uncultured Sphaerochaeta sp.]
MDTMQFGSDWYDENLMARNETLFTTANGYLGFRGDFEEKEGSYHKGTYINGFFDSEPIVYGETAFGYAKNHETILNLPDPKRIELTVGKRPFSLKRGTLNSFSRNLDFHTGVLSRFVDWTSEDGNRVVLCSRRLVSFIDKNCAVIEYSVTAKGNPLHICLRSSIEVTSDNRSANEDPRVGSKFSSRPLLILETGIEENQLSFIAKTRNSNLSLRGAAFHVSSTIPARITKFPSDLAIEYCFDLEEGETVTLTKYIAYCTEGDDERFLAHKFASKGFPLIAREQKEYLDSFWNLARIRIEGDDLSEQALQLNLFHLLQSCGKEGKTSMAAKGLTGEGYEGHYFWDTESYVLPIFTYLKPELAEQLLKYRYSILPQSRKRAETMNLKGALFPWRTISGNECSAYFPAGTAQYHIDADILFAAQKCFNASGKEIPPWIVEMAIESARMWASLGSYVASKGNRFCINEVTGPDEYTACVDNNAYTNLMARENLLFCCEVVKKYQDQGKQLPLELRTGELHQWQGIAEAMYIPFDKELGIYPQDDSFLFKADWPFFDTPREKYPLLLHYHPLVIYRHRVLKQPDLVLAQFLLSGLFTKAEKIRNFAFYEPYTTGDSSLSHCIQSIMASESFQSVKAWWYFKKTVRMDIDDIHGNSADGIHTASMAGSWMALVYGFAGFRDWKGTFSFNPQLPDSWKSVSFCLSLRSSVVKIHFTKEEVTYSLVAGKALSLIHRNESFVLEEGENRCFSLVPALEGVLFDLDGVIVDTAKLHYLAWKSVSDRYGLAFDTEVNKKLLGVSRDTSLAIILEHNKVVWDEEKKQQALEQKNEAYVASLDILSPKDVFPKMRELLQNLQHAGIYTALVSASKNAKAVCAKLQILDLFDAFADVRKVQKSKPEPDLFLVAAEQIGVWYSNCIGIEDAKAGIQAIKKAGMKAVGIGTAEELPEADYVLVDTTKLTVELLQGILNT